MPAKFPLMCSSFNKEDFRNGILHFSPPVSDVNADWMKTPVVDVVQGALPTATTPAAAYQMLLAADALRYLTLQLAATKASGHPGGFCSSAEIVATLILLGHKNLFTEVGHHAPGYYSALFLDGSLERIGIRTVTDLSARFRESHGLLGHLSGAIPGVLAPAGPLGQGQHFAWAAALLNRDILCPVTIGDGGMGEPYVMSALKHYLTAYPEVTNVLPVLIWNGFSQEHHSMVSTMSNEEMIAFWRAHGFAEAIMVDAKSFDDAGQPTAFVDSTKFTLPGRMAFGGAVIDAARRAAHCALTEKRPTVLILKQLKGAGSHGSGSKSHHLYPQFTLQHPDIISGLQRRALTPEGWTMVRDNFRRAGGGSAAEIVVTERTRARATYQPLPLREFPVGDQAQIPSSALSPLVAALAQADSDFIATNADGNEASGLRAVSDALRIRHPVRDDLYSQSPDGRVFEPISEDACAGLASAWALMGARSIWFSYESFAVNGIPVWQTVAQAMVELRRLTPSAIAMFTAGALEQGRNGWTHQRPEIEGYLMALARSGNIHPLFPIDANSMQAAYEWAVGTSNQGIAIIGSKTAIPVRLTLAQSRAALAQGAVTLYESAAPSHLNAAKTIVLAVVGDLILGPVFAAKDQIVAAGHRVRIVAVIAPRRLFRSIDVAWEQITLPEARDSGFLEDSEFEALFEGDALLGITGGAGAVLEPVLARANVPHRDLVAWRRGDTTATAAQLIALNQLDPDSLAARAKLLLADHPARNVPQATMK
jgi:phosphoketolase